jgi:hypothetical protein
MGKNAKIASKGHRKTKAALAAGAVASTVAATAAYRRRSARHHLGNAQAPRFDAGPAAGPGDTQPL